MTVPSPRRADRSSQIRRWQLVQAARHVNAGGVIAYPTEAVYGLGCDPRDGAAVLRLLKLKQRPIAKGLILIAARFEDLQPYIAKLPAETLSKLRKSWPGPVTWLLPARPEVPYWLKGSHATLAVRITAHPLAAALCRACGGVLVSTSANISKRPPARSALAVRRCFGADIDYVLNGALGGLDKPTRIIDAQSGRVVRAA
ncbi:MAG: SUA5/yciO/yrdC domain protein [Proteobacteria bacterium]|nr:SUA5/yciO/yrdC domain protein [Pseudomonadota bacterium]